MERKRWAWPLEAARVGLLDAEPGVRSQCALVLGNLVDKASLDSLTDHLVDPVPLVAAASARAIGHIGRNEPSAKGKAARALVAALDEAKGAAEKEVHSNLVYLAGVDHGKRVVMDGSGWSAWEGNGGAVAELWSFDELSTEGGWPCAYTSGFSATIQRGGTVSIPFRANTLSMQPGTDVTLPAGMIADRPVRFEASCHFAVARRG